VVKVIKFDDHNLITNSKLKPSRFKTGLYILYQIIFVKRKIGKKGKMGLINSKEKAIDRGVGEVLKTGILTHAGYIENAVYFQMKKKRFLVKLLTKNICI